MRTDTLSWVRANHACDMRVMRGNGRTDGLTEKVLTLRSESCDYVTRTRAYRIFDGLAGFASLAGAKR